MIPERRPHGDPPDAFRHTEGAAHPQDRVSRALSILSYELDQSPNPPAVWTQCRLPWIEQLLPTIPESPNTLPTYQYLSIILHVDQVVVKVSGRHFLTWRLKTFGQGAVYCPLALGAATRPIRPGRAAVTWRLDL